MPPVRHHLVGSCAVILGGLVDCSPVEDTAGVVSTQADASTCVASTTLKHRPEGEAVSLVEGVVEETGGSSWLLVRQGQYVTLEGQGYLNLRWQIEFRAKVGLITPPAFTVSSGTFLHVGGGGRNLGEPLPGTTETGMGDADAGYSYMPEGVTPPWQNEFYYLDGQATIAIQEFDGLYNINVIPQTYDQVVTPGWGVYEPGVVYDPDVACEG